MRKRQISGYEAGKRVQALWVEHATDLDSIEDNRWLMWVWKAHKSSASL